jgi:hypothetical protein
VVHLSLAEAKKLADRDRKAAERSVQAKADALREDDNVYDVSYEGQGTSMQEVAATATDVKVCVGGGRGSGSGGGGGSAGGQAGGTCL